MHNQHACALSATSINTRTVSSTKHVQRARSSNCSKDGGLGYIAVDEDKHHSNAYTAQVLRALLVHLPAIMKKSKSAERLRADQTQRVWQKEHPDESDLTVSEHRLAICSERQKRLNVRSCSLLAHGLGRLGARSYRSLPSICFGRNQRSCSV